MLNIKVLIHKKKLEQVMNRNRKLYQLTGFAFLFLGALLSNCDNKSKQKNKESNINNKVIKNLEDSIVGIYQPYSRRNDFYLTGCETVDLAREFSEVIPKIDFFEWRRDSLYTRVFTLRIDSLQIIALENVLGNDLFFYRGEEFARYNCNSSYLNPESEVGIDYLTAKYYFGFKNKLLVIIAVPSRFTGNFTNYSLIQFFDLRLMKFKRIIQYTDSIALPIRSY